jgi:hypothetical protein
MTISQKKTKTTDNTTFVGIDYSMTSPAIAIYRGKPKDFHWKKVEFHYYTPITALAKDWERDGKPWCRGYGSLTIHANNEERFLRLATWTLATVVGKLGELVPNPKNVRVALEDYALGGSGRVFEIAENTGCLKQILRAAEYDFDLYPPTVVKKFATGKGNSDKDKMYAAWLEETEFDIWKEMIPKRGKISSPVTDIVDAYFILKKLVTEENK